MGYKLYTGDLYELKIKGKVVINTINPHSYAVAKRDPVFANALQDADILLPDGVGICLAAKLAYGESISRLSGSDLHEVILEKLDKEGGKVFYMGGEEKTLGKIKEKINARYTNITVSTYAPPFCNTFSKRENEKILNKINSFKPNALFVGLTAPKQEKWLYLNTRKLDFEVASCIGAVFDFFGDSKQRPRRFWRAIGLEWLIRLLNEPTRLWRRALISLPIFLFDLLVFIIRSFKRRQYQ